MRIYVYFLVRVWKDYARSNEKDDFPKLNYLLTKIAMYFAKTNFRKKLFDFYNT